MRGPHRRLLGHKSVTFGAPVMRIRFSSKDLKHPVVQPTSVPAAPARHPSSDKEGEVPAVATRDRHELQIRLERITISIIVTEDSDDGECTDSSTVHANRSAGRVEREADGSLRVQVVHTSLARQMAWAARYPTPGEAPALHPAVARDAAIERLARALVIAEDMDHVFARTYVNAVCVAIISRLIAIHTDNMGSTTKPPA